MRKKKSLPEITRTSLLTYPGLQEYEKYKQLCLSTNLDFAFVYGGEKVYDLSERLSATFPNLEHLKILTYEPYLCLRIGIDGILPHLKSLTIVSTIENDQDPREIVIELGKDLDYVYIGEYLEKEPLTLYANGYKIYNTSIHCNLHIYNEEEDGCPEGFIVPYEP